jgi:hypothetical protein
VLKKGRVGIIAGLEPRVDAKKIFGKGPRRGAAMEVPSAAEAAYPLQLYRSAEGAAPPKAKQIFIVSRFESTIGRETGRLLVPSAFRQHQNLRARLPS